MRKPDASVFANDSTMLLVKKYFVYKLMGSNVFINYSLFGMNVCYKLFGVKLTNFAINNSVASIFTSGETVSSIKSDIIEHERKGVNGIGGYVVEGLPKMDTVKIDRFYNAMLKFIRETTEGRTEGHFALKFTAIISIDIMTRMSRAQYTFMNDILKFDKQETIDISDLKNSLLERGVTFTNDELELLFKSLKFENNESGNISRLERYANAHLFKLDSESRKSNQDLMQRIAIGCGVGISEEDLQIFENFSNQVNTMTDLANERNCMLYIDAEQTFMQSSIESFG